MKLRKRNFKKAGGTYNFWPSFTDVMATISLVLFLLMLLAYIQYIIAGNNLAIADEKLASADEKLRALGKDLEYNRKILDDTEKQLESSRLEISQAEKDLEFLKNEILNTTAELEDGKRQLTLSQKEVENQKKIIANSNQELSNLRTKLESIAVLRVDILKKVKKSIEDQIGTANDQGQPLVTIGENANLIINESVLFELGESEISYDGQKLLREFAIAFENLLDDPNARDFIDTINIEGHADAVGDPDDNMELSSQRAYNVVNYLMEANPRLLGKYARFFAASGFSEHRKIINTQEENRKNRRIEISVNIKDSNIQKIIDEYLDDTQKYLQGN